MDRLAPPGEYLVRVGLVPHVPYQTVVRRVVDVMQRDAQLDRAEVGRQVPAGLAHRLDQETAQLVGELRQLRALQLAQIIRQIDGIQQRVHQNFLNTMKSASSRRRCAAAPNPSRDSSASRYRRCAMSRAACMPSRLT